MVLEWDGGAGRNLATEAGARNERTAQIGVKDGEKLAVAGPGAGGARLTTLIGSTAGTVSNS